MEADSEVGDLMAVSSSHPGVAGVAYLPFLKGGASPSSLDETIEGRHHALARHTALGLRAAHRGRLWAPWLLYVAQLMLALSY